MLYHLLYQLHTTYSGFNVFRYITFRAAMAALMALAVSFVLGPGLIRSLTEKQIGQQIRDDGPASHSTKAGTPTMGGSPHYSRVVFLHGYACGYHESVHFDRTFRDRRYWGGGVCR